MPDMIVVNRTDAITFGADEAADVHYSGDIYVGQTSEQGPYSFSVDVPRSALAATINAAIITAAVTACAARDITVGALDNKTLIGGAVGL